jgi:signal transduction histidine kinase
MPDQSPLLSAVHLAARKLASTRNFDEVLREVLRICVEAVGATGGTIYLHDPDKRVLQFRHVLPEEAAQVLAFKDIPEDYGVAGQVFTSRKAVISNFDPEDEERKRVGDRVGVSTQIRTMITVPLMMEDEAPLGVVQLINKTNGQFDGQDAMVLDTVSAVSTMAFLNSKLLDDSTRASQLLGMGKVGHDIKNLAFALEANVSYSDDTIRQLREGVKASNAPSDVADLVEEIDWTFNELSGSIDRIKRYSTLMSDLSAGKELDPTMKLGPMGEALRMGAAFLESQARDSCVRMEYEIQDDAPLTAHDEMYIFRISQNLVSNAIKAVGELSAHADPEKPESWRSVVVGYRFDNDKHIFEVTDQGPGMTPEVADKILRGTARSVWGRSSGSGWGTKIVLELAQTHHGEVTIDSEVGVGSTFRISFPHQSE